MRKTRIALFTLLLLGMAAGTASAAISGPVVGVSFSPSRSPTVNLGFFYDDLAPYGNWVRTPSYGWAWTPLGVADTWQPYEDGHWVWTDQGWTWISDEPFGWATYHYGRWYDDPALGWAWVPGYDWAPSWVTFQESADYIGWAPLPPRARVVSGFNRVALAPSAYVFVPEERFLATNLVDFILPAPRAVAVFPTTRNATFFRVVDDRVFVTGVPVRRFGRVRTFRVADFGEDLRLRGPRFAGDRVGFFRPRVRRAAFVAPPSFRRAARNSVVSFDEIQRVRRFREAPPPWAPAWGRRGLAPGQLKQRERAALAPPRTVRLPDRDDRVRFFRERAARARVLQQQVLRQPERIREVRPLRTVRRDAVRPERTVRREVRPERTLRRDTRPERPVTRQVRPERSVRREVRPPRSVRREVRPERSVRRQVRPERSVRRQARPERSRVRQARPERSMRQHVRSAPQRMRAQPAQRQQRQARPPRQQGRPGRHRPPR